MVRVTQEEDLEAPMKEVQQTFKSPAHSKHTNPLAAFADRNVGRDFNRAQGAGLEEAGAGARGRGRGRGGPRRGGDRHSRAGHPKYVFLASQVTPANDVQRTPEAS